MTGERTAQTMPHVVNQNTFILLKTENSAGDGWLFSAAPFFEGGPWPFDVADTAEQLAACMDRFATAHPSLLKVWYVNDEDLIEELKAVREDIFRGLPIQLPLGS